MTGDILHPMTDTADTHPEEETAEAEPAWPEPVRPIEPPPPVAKARELRKGEHTRDFVVTSDDDGKAWLPVPCFDTDINWVATQYGRAEHASHATSTGTTLVKVWSAPAGQTFTVRVSAAPF